MSNIMFEAMEAIVKVLGNNIRTLRKESNWTQEMLAEKADISVPFMTQIELGRKSASLEVIERIAEAFGVSYDTLFKSQLVEVKDITHKLRIFKADIIKSVTQAVDTEFEQLDLQ